MAVPKIVRSVERAIDILLSFDRKRPSMDVSEIQKIVGLARPTLYRLLNTLESKEFVRSVGEPRRYEIGYRVVELANLWLAEATIVRVSQPILEELWLSTDETVGLMLPLSPTRRLCAIELKSRQPLSFSYGFGHTGLTYLGASGKVMLAHMPSEDINSAIKEAATKAKIVSKNLLDELNRIRKDGYAVTESEITVGAIAIAAPIFDHEGTIAGTVSLYGPAVRLKKSECLQCTDKVRKAAAKISTALGYRSSAKSPRAEERARGSVL